MSTYTGDWQTYEHLKGAYENAPPKRQIVYAAYETGCYEGSALVVWVDNDGQWWENNDSHCSCYGLENWSPEKTSKAALLMRTGWDGLHDAVRSRRVRRRVCLMTT